MLCTFGHFFVSIGTCGCDITRHRRCGTEIPSGVPRPPSVQSQVRTARFSSPPPHPGESSAIRAEILRRDRSLNPSSKNPKTYATYASGLALKKKMGPVSNSCCPRLRVMVCRRIPLLTGPIQHAPKRQKSLVFENLFYGHNDQRMSIIEITDPRGDCRSSLGLFDLFCKRELECSRLRAAEKITQKRQIILTCLCVCLKMWRWPIGLLRRRFCGGGGGGNWGREGIANESFLRVCWGWQGVDVRSIGWPGSPTANDLANQSNACEIRVL